MNRILSIEKLDRYGRSMENEAESAEIQELYHQRTSSAGRRGGSVRVRVTPENGEPFTISGSRASRLGLTEGGELSPELQESILKTLRASCMQRCGTLLGSRDYPVERLRTKLLDAGFPPSIVAECIGKLCDAHYLDDRRYAQNYVRSHINDRSILRIRLVLTERGISSDIVDEVFSDISQESDTDEAQIAQIRRILQKRGYCPEQSDYAERQKTMAFLYRKGYGHDLIRRAIETDPI